MTTYTTLRDLIDQEIAPALDGVDEGFDVDALVRILRDSDLIVYDGRGFTMPGDPDSGATEAFWEAVQAVDLIAIRGGDEREMAAAAEVLTGGTDLDALAGRWQAAQSAEREARRDLVGGIVAASAQGVSDSEIQRVTGVSRVSIAKYLGRGR